AHFPVTSDQWIDLSVCRALVQIKREGLKRVDWRATVFVSAACWKLVPRSRGQLRDSMRDIVEHVQPRDAFGLQKKHGVTALLDKNSSQNVARIHFLLAGRMHVRHGALKQA